MNLIEEMGKFEWDRIHSFIRIQEIMAKEETKDNTTIAIEIASNCLNKFKNHIVSPLTYTEFEEDGSVSHNQTILGEALFNIIYEETLTKLKKDDSKLQ